MQKALDIIFELLSSLDREAGGELAERLSALYVYFINEIGVVSRSLDRARLEQLIAMIAGLHESMAHAARRVMQERAR
jgi:flagellar protein FliS